MSPKLAQEYDIFYYTTLHSISHALKFSYNISGAWCMRSECGVWNPECSVWILELSIHHAPDFQQWIMKNPYTTLQIWNASLCNLDTTLITREIWKYLSRAAVFFETIHHSGIFETIHHSGCALMVYGFKNALMVYGFKKHCYPRKIFLYFMSDKCRI